MTLLENIKWEEVVALIGALTVLGSAIATFLHNKRLVKQTAELQTKTLAQQTEIERLKANTTLEVHNGDLAIKMLEADRERINRLEERNAKYETEIEIRREEVFAERERSEKALEAERERTEKVRKEKHILAESVQHLITKHEKCISDLNIEHQEVVHKMREEHTVEKMELETRIRQLEEQIEYLKKMIEEGGFGHK